MADGEPGAPFAVYRSRRRWVLLQLLVLPFVALGVAVTAAGDVGGAFLALFFGLVWALFLANSVAPPTLALYEEGFQLKYLGPDVPFCRWQDVDGFGVWRPRPRTSVVGFRYSGRPSQRLGMRKRRPSFGNSWNACFFDTFGVSPVWLALELQRARNRRVGG